MTSGVALSARGVWAGYDGLAAVRDMNLVVHSGEVVALLGPNGAGKTTLLMALAGAISPMKGTIEWFGQPAKGRLHERIKAGLGFVPEQRSIVSRLSVRDNLLLGAGGLSALDLFPELASLVRRPAGLLSGGEQQMLVLARALAARPKVLLVDELSLGLAPIVVSRLFEVVKSAANTDGVAVVLVEQQARRALRVADRWYLLRQGELIEEGQSEGTPSDISLATRFIYGDSEGGSTHVIS